MGFLDSILGRSRPKAPNLDSLFAVPSAALTLEAGLGFTPTGRGSVCFRAPSGLAFAQTRDEVVALLRADSDAPEVSTEQDAYGFTWLVVEGDPADVSGLVTQLHAVNAALEAQGFATGLLCTVVPFTDGRGTSFGLVYLYKQGTFYPFAPRGGQQRDTVLEMQLRDALAGDLPVEKDLQRWLALWDAPGL